MKYDKDTMNSLQEAYASVNETYKGGKIVKPNRNKQTGNPPISKNQSSKTSNKKPKTSMPTGGDGTAYYGEAIEPEGMKYSDKKKLERQEKLKKASKKAPVVMNKIVGFNKESYERRIKAAHKMSRQEYNKINNDFKGEIDKDGNAYVVVGQDTPTGNRETRRRQFKITDEVDKKKEMEDKMKEVEDMRSLPTRMNLIKTKLRAMGLNMSHQLKGKELSEVIDYTLTERTRYQKEMGIGKGGTAKNDLAFQKVMRDHQDERMGANQKKKKRGAKTDEGTGKFTKMLARKKQQQAANKAFAARAKAAGETPQQRADRAAIYGSEENMEKGIGSGS